MKLKKFIINGLFGFQQVEIPFDKNIKILIGENGLGKTTVLNSLYFVLSKKFERLAKVHFSTIELQFDDKKKVVIEKKRLEYYITQAKRNREGKTHFSQLLSKINSNQLNELKEVVFNENLKEQNRRMTVVQTLKDIGVNIDAPTAYIYSNIKKYFEEIDAYDFQRTIDALNEHLKSKILYFPTYRRVEEELKNMGLFSRQEMFEKYGHFIQFEDESFSERHPVDEDIIQFGMGDVEERISTLTKEIAHSSIVGFSQITGEMLHQLLTDFPNVKPAKASKREIEKINIVLQRVGPNMSDEDKKRILEFIESGATSNKGLLFFIQKLTELYNRQEQIDTSIKKFVEVCNGYLRRKKYVYDEREVTLKIRREGNDDEVLLNQLSSGEKQIVSLFSKIYLEKETDYVILFDEPELSLSVFWQQKLLPDITKSEKCKFLLAVTHSPFIYDNELKEYAVGLNEYIKTTA